MSVSLEQKSSGVRGQQKTSEVSQLEVLKVAPPKSLTARPENMAFLVGRRQLSYWVLGNLPSNLGL